MKAVRETMNRTLELWKEVPGVFDEVSESSQSKSSSIGNDYSFKFVHYSFNVLIVDRS